jgi:perosamine synthetase
VSRRLTIWAPLPLDVYLARPSRLLPFPLNEPNYRLFSRARHGLWHGVRAIGLRPGETVLMPAYNHGSEIEALRRAGLACRFYEVGQDLQPDGEELESLVDPTVRALYLIHYFGMPQAVDHWRTWCDERGLLLIEDAAMAFLSSWQGRPIGSFGDLAIYCVYKSFGLPDGGAMICSASPAFPTSRRRLGMIPAMNRHGSWLAQRHSSFATLHALMRGEKHYMLEADFGLGDAGSGPTLATVALLPRLAHAEVAERRRRNYRFLLEGLAAHTQPLFEDLPDGACPVAFTILLGGRRQVLLRDRLLDEGIRLANFWPHMHPSLQGQRFPRSETLRANVVGLPVHQELRKQDLELIVASVRTTIDST